MNDSLGVASLITPRIVAINPAAVVTAAYFKLDAGR